MSPREEFGLWLADCRVGVGLTQKDVAKKLGYSTPQHISNYERGLAVPSLRTIGLLVKMFKLTPVQWTDAWRRMKAAELEEDMQILRLMLKRGA